GGEGGIVEGGVAGQRQRQDEEQQGQSAGDAAGDDAGEHQAEAPVRLPGVARRDDGLGDRLAQLLRFLGRDRPLGLGIEDRPRWCRRGGGRRRRNRDRQRRGGGAVPEQFEQFAAVFGT